MPQITKTVKAEKFFTHKGVSIYHTYRDDDMGLNPPRDYDFVTRPYDEENDAFDVRNVFFMVNKTEWVEPNYAELDLLVKKTLKQGIDQGFITANGMNVPTPENFRTT